MAAEHRDYLFYQTRKKLPLIQKARGVRMWDDSGREYIDACSGAMVCNIGHGHPRILEAIKRQADSAFFAYRLQFESRPALELAQKLVAHTADHLDRVFFISGGSEAVETAMKLCRQYFYSRGEGGRHLFISRIPSYHGCTLGALALTGYAPLEAPFRPLFQAYPKIPAPYCYRCPYDGTYPQCGLRCAHALEEVLREQGPQNVAAFVTEPIGGASTGAIVPPDEYFGVIETICRKYGIMLILDEILTGFGRTGRLFAYEHWQVRADILAISKGMASGYYPLGAVMTRADIAAQVLDSGGFAHGHTYAGNPMACAVGLEVFNIIEEENLVRHAADMEPRLRMGLESLADRHGVIGQVRGRGLLMAVELVADPNSRKPFAPELEAAERLTDTAYDLGLIIYPRRPINGLAGDHVLIAPPLTVTDTEIAEILNRLDEALARTAAALAQGEKEGGRRG